MSQHNDLVYIDHTVEGGKKRNLQKQLSNESTEKTVYLGYPDNEQFTANALATLICSETYCEGQHQVDGPLLVISLLATERVPLLHCLSIHHRLGNPDV